eukprot:scaffold218495_cov31-Tisochrysis_lutea.AAC.2
MARCSNSFWHNASRQVEERYRHGSCGIEHIEERRISELGVAVDLQCSGDAHLADGVYAVDELLASATDARVIARRLEVGADVVLVPKGDILGGIDVPPRHEWLSRLGVTQRVDEDIFAS